MKRQAEGAVISTTLSARTMARRGWCRRTPIARRIRRRQRRSTSCRRAGTRTSASCTWACATTIRASGGSSRPIRCSLRIRSSACAAPSSATCTGTRRGTRSTSSTIGDGVRVAAWRATEVTIKDSYRTLLGRRGGRWILDLSARTCFVPPMRNTPNEGRRRDKAGLTTLTLLCHRRPHQRAVEAG